VKCINCDNKLEGLQRSFCSNRCKQAIKNQINKGERCRRCKVEMEPKKVLGGYKQFCSKACQFKR
jgi:hypothetical protein